MPKLAKQAGYHCQRDPGGQRASEVTENLWTLTEVGEAPDRALEPWERNAIEGNENGASERTRWPLKNPHVTREILEKAGLLGPLASLSYTRTSIPDQLMPDLTMCASFSQLRWLSLCAGDGILDGELTVVPSTK